MGFLLLTVLGAVLILVGIADVFFTVLHYDGFGFLSSRLYEWTFKLLRFLTKPFPRRRRALGLSLAAPLMVLVTITFWIVLVATGYALVYFAGMRADPGGAFTFSRGLEPSLLEAFYISGGAISTVGFGDVTPVAVPYQILAVSESLIGFGLLTLAITYVLGVYAVLQKLSELAATLYHQAHDTADPWTILIPHFPQGRVRDIDSPLIELHRSLVSLHEGMRLYPVVYYFHSRRAYRSLPYAVRMIGGTAAALRWGLPEDHEATQAPYLPTLLVGLDAITSHIEEHFIARKLPPVPDPVPLEEFTAAFEGDGETDNYFLRRFVEMERFMRDLARLEVPPTAAEAHARYKEWLPFSHRNRNFFEATAHDLGYDLDELTHGPGKKLF